MSLLDEALASNAEEATPFKDVDTELGGKHLPFRFYALDGEKWSEIVAFCPARLGSAIDRRYGYNFQAAARLAAPLCGRLIDQGAEIEVTDEQWTELFKKFKGHNVKLIHSAIWELNEYDPEVRVVNAKKGSAAVSPPKPS